MMTTIRSFAELELHEVSRRPRDEGRPHPKDKPWPLNGVPTWNEFQHAWDGVGGHMTPVRLVAVYEMVLALAIYDKLKGNIK